MEGSTTLRLTKEASKMLGEIAKKEHRKKKDQAILLIELAYADMLSKTAQNLSKIQLDLMETVKYQEVGEK